MIGLATGYVATHRLWPGRFGITSFSLSVGAGFGCVSLVAYLWLVLGKPGRLALLALEAVSLAGAFALRRRTPSVPGNPVAGPPGVLAPVLLVAVAAAGVGMLHTFREFPIGAWDAVEIWNMRAVSFLRGGLSAAFEGVRHQDYPLLLPLVVSHLQVSTGEQPLVNLAVAAAFTFATAALLYCATARARGGAPAAIVTTVLLASPLFAFHGASQRADVPLGYFLLASMVCLTLDGVRRHGGLLVLAGIQIGCGLWTKNEGILFALLVPLVWLATAGRSQLRRSWRIGAGAAPFALALAYHKLTCGGVTDLIAGQGAATWERLADVSRYGDVGEAFLTRGAAYLVAGVVLALLFAREAPRPGPGTGRFVTLTLLGILAGYFMVYVVTPHELGWHLESSLGRLLLTLWPTALYAVALGGAGAWAPSGLSDSAPPPSAEAEQAG